MWPFCLHPYTQSTSLTFSALSTNPVALRLTSPHSPHSFNFSYTAFMGTTLHVGSAITIAAGVIGIIRCAVL